MSSIHKINYVHPLTSRLARAICFVISFACPSLMVQAQSMNGFDLSRSSISIDDIFAGGPPRDGIPAIDQPNFISANKVDFLSDEDIVIGLVHGTNARAYPLRILVWHEIVNDVIDKRPVAVTYCPLCGTGMVFHRTVGDTVRTFGVSGLLYQSDVLMYDRESESLWSQLAMKAVSGSAVGQELIWLPSEHMTWKAWREIYPQGQVLSTDTGYSRDYGGEAYAAYFASNKPLFPVPHTRPELPNMAWVIGVIIDGEPKAYPVNALPAAGTVKDTIGQTQVVVHYNAMNRHPNITNAQGETIPSVMVFWFAWQAFYPQTELWVPKSAHR